MCVCVCRHIDGWQIKGYKPISDGFRSFSYTCPQPPVPFCRLLHLTDTGFNWPGWFMGRTLFCNWWGSIHLFKFVRWCVICICLLKDRPVFTEVDLRQERVLNTFRINGKPTKPVSGLPVTQYCSRVDHLSRKQHELASIFVLAHFNSADDGAFRHSCFFVIFYRSWGPRLKLANVS